MRGLLWLGVLIISLAGLFRAEKVGILMVGKTPRELYDQVLTTLQTKIRLRETKCPSVLDEFIKEDFKQGGATFCFQFISFKSDKYERFAEFRVALEQSVPRNFRVIFGRQEDYGSTHGTMPSAICRVGLLLLTSLQGPSLKANPITTIPNSKAISSVCP